MIPWYFLLLKSLSLCFFWLTFIEIECNISLGAAPLWVVNVPPLQDERLCFHFFHPKWLISLGQVLLLWGIFFVLVIYCCDLNNLSKWAVISEPFQRFRCPEAVLVQEHCASFALDRCFLSPHAQCERQGWQQEPVCVCWVSWSVTPKQHGLHAV